jgi:cytochrome c oxidase subunit III
MILPTKFTRDVAELPTHAFSHRSLTWWGVIGFMVIEGMFFALTFAAYFFLMSQESAWPPEPGIAPDPIAGTLFTIVILASEIPNSWIKKAANAYDVEKVRKLIWIPVVVGLLLFALRAFEFNSLNVRWTDNAYGSVIWCLLFLHTLHVGTDWVDTVVLASLIRTTEGEEPRKLVDVDENSLYWRFVWLTWLPIYLLIYWVPRWVG